MNIPKRNGHYELKIGQNTIVIDIKNESERMSKLDKIQAGDTSRIGGYKNVTKYYAKVIDAAGNVIDALPEYYASNKNKYVDFISSFVGKENGASVNPNKMLEKLGIKFQQDTGLYLMDSKFNGIVKNKIKYTFYVDNWSSKFGGIYDPNEIATYFEKLGVVCKIAEKKKNVRAGQCWVASIYLPLDFSLNESKNMKKQLIKLTESDLHRIIIESVERVLKEDGLAGGGATNCAATMQTGSGKAHLGTNPEAGQYTVPFGADAATADRHPGFSVDGKAKGKTSVISRPVYNPKSGKKKLGENSELNQVEESPLWNGNYSDYMEDTIHKRKVYRYLCKMFDTIMNNLKEVGLEPSVAFKALMPLQEEIKSHEEY